MAVPKVTSILRSLRMRQRSTGLGTALRKIGVTDIARRVYEKRVLSAGVHETILLGESLRFAVKTRREITRFDSLVGEEAFITRLLESIRPGDVCFDVGANVGMVTVLIAARHRDAGVVVHAFEPEPRHAAELRANAELNKLSDIHVHEIALGADPGTLKLFVDADLGSGGHSLVQGHTSASEVLEVGVQRGSDFARAQGVEPDMVKIDVEGWEFDVLTGLDELFVNGRIRELLVELHPHTLSQRGQSPESIRAWLTERGYRSIWLQDRSHQVHEHFRRE